VPLDILPRCFLLLADGVARCIALLHVLPPSGRFFYDLKTSFIPIIFLFGRPNATLRP